MTYSAVFTSAPLRRATSRSYTAPQPLKSLQIVRIESAAPFDILYAGPPLAAVATPPLPGRITPPGHGSTAQILARASASSDARVAVLIDLGGEFDVARIEFLGNLLLPPRFKDRRPVHNFGLPRGIGIAVSEEFRSYHDLHGRMLFEGWIEPAGTSWHVRYRSAAFRALWGWTPVHLPPTFGRYLMLDLWDLPSVPDGADGWRPGLDIRSIAVFPFLERDDHRSSVEYAPLSSCQTRYSLPSVYWTLQGEAAPAPADQHSIHVTPGGEVLQPGVLVGMVHDGAATRTGFYASDSVEPDSDDRVLLTLQATTDEVPLIGGVGLVFRQPFIEKMGGPLPDYRIAVFVSNDDEAALSADVVHPGWRLAAPWKRLGTSAAAPTFSTRIMFAYARRARYVRLEVQVMSAGIVGEERRFVLAGLALIRPRDFIAMPEPGEDLQLDHVLIRLRGAALVDDYAYVDGRNGMGLTLEAQDESGNFRTIQSFRSLVSLMENAQTRVFQNARYADKPVHRSVETANHSTATAGLGWTEQQGESQSTVRPEFGNRQVTAAATVTRHTRLPRDGIDGVTFTAVPAGPLESVETRRWYALPRPDSSDLAVAMPSQFPPTSAQFGNAVDQFLMMMESAGRPVTISVGLNGGMAVTGGVQLVGGVSVTPSGGASISASAQVGGGTTRSVTLGEQGAAAKSETKTIESFAKQENRSTQHTTSQQSSIGVTERVVERRDESPEVRRAGVGVHYGGAAEDIVLIALPVGLRLAGPMRAEAGVAGRVDPPGQICRVRVDHLPPGVSIDVEFRGAILVHGRGS